jgi:septum formation protein
MQESLILASTSLYRAGLLERLGLPFATRAPGVAEEPLPGEQPRDRVLRLARAKALAVGARHPQAWVLGSDQLALRDGEVLGKPLERDRCEAQLLASSGRLVSFLTSACLLRVADDRMLEHVDTTLVQFRALSAEEVRRYVDRERPLDCAGGFKCEGLGIALFDRIESVDPTALIGLPLIWVAQALREVGLDPLGEWIADSG